MQIKSIAAAVLALPLLAAADDYSTTTMTSTMTATVTYTVSHLHSTTAWNSTASYYPTGTGALPTTTGPATTAPIAHSAGNAAFGSAAQVVVVGVAGIVVAALL